MGILDLTAQSAVMPATGAGALIAAWLTWRLWRRVLRTVITCVVVAVVVYLAFPDVAHRMVEHIPALTSTDTVVH